MIATNVKESVVFMGLTRRKISYRAGERAFAAKLKVVATQKRENRTGTVSCIAWLGRRSANEFNHRRRSNRKRLKNCKTTWDVRDAGLTVLVPKEQLKIGRSRRRPALSRRTNARCFASS